MDMNL